MPLLFCFTGTLSTGVELMWEGSLRCRRFIRTTHEFEAFEMSSMDSLFSSISCCLLDVSVGVSHYLCFMISPVVYLCSYFFKGPDNIQGTSPIWSTGHIWHLVWPFNLHNMPCWSYFLSEDWQESQHFIVPITVQITTLVLWCSFCRVRVTMTNVTSRLFSVAAINCLLGQIKLKAEGHGDISNYRGAWKKQGGWRRGGSPNLRDVPGSGWSVTCKGE